MRRNKKLRFRSLTRQAAPSPQRSAPIPLPADTSHLLPSVLGLAQAVNDLDEALCCLWRAGQLRASLVPESDMAGVKAIVLDDAQRAGSHMQLFGAALPRLIDAAVVELRALIDERGDTIEVRVNLEGLRTAVQAAPRLFRVHFARVLAFPEVSDATKAAISGAFDALDTLVDTLPAA
ncbi:MAG: hypothetical protein K2Y26_01040 [Gemmatimonadaceae bacterium]|nr:hypothetical protein [Gemmatimonadaceae bacterium]